jgi:protein-disulfide isomerase
MTKAPTAITRRAAARLGLAAGAAACLAPSAHAQDNPMPPELREAIERQPFAPVLGNAKGNITLTEFFDYNCPYCRAGFPDLRRLIGEDPELRVVYREWPIFGEDSLAASQVSLATLKQGKYWDFHSAMMESKGRAAAATALRVAEKAGLDMAKLKRDMQSDDVMGHIDHSIALGDHMGLAGTPTFIAGHGGLFGKQSLQDLRALVAQARADLL